MKYYVIYNDSNLAAKCFFSIEDAKSFYVTVTCKNYSAMLVDDEFNTVATTAEFFLDQVVPDVQFDNDKNCENL